MASSVIVWVVGKRPRRTPLFQINHKKVRLDFGKVRVGKPQSFWGRKCLARYISSLILDVEMKHTKKMGLVCSSWHEVSLVCMGYNEISRLSKYSRKKRTRMAKSLLYSYSEVTYMLYEHWSKSYWTSVERADIAIWRKHPSNLMLMKNGPKYLLRGAQLSLKVTNNLTEASKRLCNKTVN